MADNTIKTKVVVTTEGLDKGVKDSKSLADNLKAAGAAASSVRVPGPIAAARQGVAASAAAASGIPSGIAPAAAQASNSSNTSRGVTGATGASARDFAAQAQGLGGLVHVYATFAANIFAVSSAFTALSKAADLSNMVKGLDQIGASSGKNLGTLAKQLTYVSDGAISMRDALGATALATAGGLTSSMILRMTQVAKNAAAALGRDMPDALERISKGIVKNQPELLDELGIMSKLIPAQQDYARSVGKSLSSLTDFEKRQAFANAVLKEGEAKFGAIELAANPYSKLLASFTNLSFKGLEQVNNLLSPIIKLLSENPVALTLAVGSFAKILINQALPGLTRYREGLEAASAASRKASVQANNNRIIGQINITDDQVTKQLLLNKQLQASYKTLSDSAFSSATKKALKAFDDAGGTAGDNLSALENRAKKLDKYLNTLSLGDASPRIVKNREIARVELASIQDVITKQKDLVEVTKQLDAVERISTKTILGKAAAYLSVDAANNRIADRAARQNTSANILSKVAADLPKTSVLEAFGSLISGIKNGIKGLDVSGQPLDQFSKKLSGISGAATVASTAVKGTFAILSTAGSTLLSSLQGPLVVIGLLVTAYGILSSVFSSNAKAADAYSASLNSVEDAVDGLTRTTDLINKKDPLDKFSIESAVALTTALQGIGDSLEQTAVSLNKLLKINATSWFDTLTNNVSRIYSGDIVSKGIQTFATSIAMAIDKLDSEELQSKFKEKIGSVLNIPKVDTESIKNALSGLSDEDASKTITKLTAALGPLFTELSNTSSELVSYKDNISLSGKSSQEFIASLTNTDPLFKFGSSLQNTSIALQKLSDTPKEAGKALVDLFKDTSKFALLSENLALQLVETRKEYTNNIVSLDNYTQSIKNAKAEVEKLQEERDKPGFLGFAKNKLAVESDNTRLENAKEKLKQLQQGKIIIEAKIEASGLKTIDLLSRAQNDFLVKGAKLVETSLGLATQKVQIAIDKAASIGLTGKESVQEELRLTLEGITVQRSLISVGEEQILAIARLNNTIELSDQRKELNSLNPQDPKYSKILESISILEKVGDALSKGAGGIKAITDRGVRLAKDFSGDVKAAPDIRAAQAVSGTYQQIQATEAKKLELSGQKREAELKAIYNTEIAIGTKKSEQLTKEADLNRLTSDRYSVLLNNSDSQNIELITAKQVVDLQETQLRQQAAKLAIQSKIDSLQKVISAPGASAASVSVNKLELEKQKLNLLDLERNQLQSNNNQLLTNAVAITSAQVAQQDKLLQVIIAQRQLTELLSQQSLDLAVAELAAKSQLNTIDEKAKVSREAQLAISRAELDYTIAVAAKRDEMNKAESSRNAQKIPLQSQLVAVEATSGSDIRATRSGNSDVQKSLNAIDEQAMRQQKVDQAAIAGFEAKKNGAIAVLKIQEETNNKLADQKLRLDAINTTVDSLVSLFDKVGTSAAQAFGEAVKGVNTYTENFAKSKGQEIAAQEALAKAQTESYAVLDDVTSTQEDITKAKKKEMDAESSLDKVKRKGTVQELNDTASIIGSTKKLFGEKTFAARALGALEKTIHVAKLAMMLTEAATAVATTPAVVAANTTKAGSSALAAITAAFAAPFPIGFVAGAAMIAIMASLLGGGSKGASVPAGLDADSKQKVQGTGQSYDANGKLVENGGGKLGDPTAISTTIKDGLEALNKTNFEMLEFDKNSTYKALVAIRDNTENFVKSLRGTTGITGGISAFGTNEGGSKGFLGIGSTSHSIIDTGIKVIGTLNDLLNGKGTRQQYETVKNTNSGFFGIGSSSNVSVNVKNLPKNVDTYIKGIVGGFNDTLFSAAETLGTTTQDISSRLNSFIFTLDTSAKGMTGQEFADTVMAQIGIELDKAATLAFPSLTQLSEQFQHFSESTSDFVLRLVNDTNNVGLAMKSIGKSFEELTVTTKTINEGGIFKPTTTTYGYGQISKANQAELLVAAADGLDNFLSATSNFSDKFLSETEKLVPINDAVIAKFKQLNIEVPSTRDAFKQLVLSFKVVDKQSAETYNALLGMASAFDSLNPQLEKTLSITDLLSEKLNQQTTIYTLQGKASLALTEQRKDELAQMDERLRSGQLYIYALQDEAQLKNDLKSAYDSESGAIKGTIQALKASVKTLKDYKQSLTLSTQSNLTPEDRYSAAKAQAQQVASIANSIIDTSKTAAEQLADQQAKTDAINQLPTVSAAFLDASRAIFASSSLYNQDFSYIQDLLDNTTSALSQQQTDAEKQLEKLDIQVGALIDIKANTATTNEILTRLQQAQANTEQTKTDAANSGLVVNAANSNIENLFSELIKKVADLSVELAGLRSDQKAQTQDIVVTTVRAQQVAAATVVEGIQEIDSGITWRNKNGYDSSMYD